MPAVATSRKCGRGSVPDGMPPSANRASATYIAASSARNGTTTWQKPAAICPGSRSAPICSVAWLRNVSHCSIVRWPGPPLLSVRLVVGTLAVQGELDLGRHLGARGSVGVAVLADHGEPGGGNYLPQVVADVASDPNRGAEETDRHV